MLVSPALAARVEIFAGNSYSGFTEGANGVGRLLVPWGFAKSSNGNIYVANIHFIAEIDSSKTIRVFAGSNVSGDTDASRLAAAFNNPRFIAFDSNGDMFISDRNNHKIKKLDMTSGVVSTFAGSSQGFNDDLGTAAQFDFPGGLVFDDDDNLYVADSGNRRIRKIDSSGNVSTVAAHDGGSSVYDGDAFSTLIGDDLGDLEIYNGEVYFADTTYNSVRKLNLDTSTISRVAGTTVDGDVLGDALTTAQFRAPRGIAIDSNGSIYISDDVTNKLYFLDINTSQVTLLASSNTFGYRDGSSSDALFNRVMDIDLLSDTELLVADHSNNSLRLYDTETFVEKELSTIAGKNSFSDIDGAFGLNSFRRPYGTAVDSSGNIYIADYDNHKIRKLDTAGNLTTLAGAAQGSRPSGTTDGTPGNLNSARFKKPADIVIDSSGNLFVADRDNHCIRKIDLGTNTVTTFSGLCGTSGNADGVAATARFKRPEGLAIDGSDNIYVSDTDNRKIRKLDTSGTSTTYAGSGSNGLVNGAAASARFNRPVGLDLDSSGNLYVADKNNHAVRRIDATTQIVTTYVGGIGVGSTDGDKSIAQFNQPHDVEVASNGDLYVADRYNHRVRRVDSNQQVDTIAANGNRGFLDADALKGSIDQAIALTINGNDLIISDFINNRLRKLDLTKISSSTSPVNKAVFFDEDLYVSSYAGSLAGHLDGFRKGAKFSNPSGLAKDSSGNIYIADTSNHRIRRLDTNGNVTTIAGIGGSGNVDGDALTVAQFNDPYDVAVASNGDVFVADRDNNSIRKISAGTVSTVVTGLNKPQGIAFDNSGNLLIANTNSHRIVIYDGSSDSVFAGSGSGFTNGEKLSTARFRNPVGITVASNGDIFVADSGNHSIRKISNSFVTTYAGVGHASFADGNDLTASFSSPGFLLIDNAGDLLVTDRNNNRVRKISKTDNKVYTLAGDGTRSFLDTRVTNAKLGFMGGLVLLNNGNILVADHNSDRLRMISNLASFNENLGIPDPEPVEKEIFVPIIRNTAPVVDLLNSIEFDANQQFSVLEGTDLTLRAFIFDAQDDNSVLEPSLTWLSSIDGIVAQATRNFNISNLSLGVHEFEVTVQDSEGETGTYEFRVNVVEAPAPGEDGDPDSDLSLSFNDAANIISIKAPRRLRFSKKKARKLRVSALQLNTIDSVASIVDDLSDEVIWEYIDFSDRNNPDITARTFMKIGKVLKLNKLPEGTYAVFARVGEADDYIKVRVTGKRVIIEPVTSSQNLKLFKKKS
ncbi:MAG: SMP-30/gluconolactonase/LRE family protein [Candidatus Caenarcaniphilales bacterium]|nr:SMP-30/gluconolactonase/LRE family protein [Candidatus Caenarcaniphilales bacterium]